MTLVCPSASAQRSSSKDKPKPRPETLRTKDGVELQAFYFPSAKGKDAIPVLIVHEWRGQASPYIPLIKALNAAGCAVLVPMYRGHGNSKTYIDRAGKEQKFDIAKMGKRDVQNILSFDMEEAKRFFKGENNEGNLNLNALVIIGIREGCVLAAHWAQRDWQFRQVGVKKQGQDVKALVFVSPKKLLEGVPLDPPMNDANLLKLPIMIVEGKTSATSDAARLHKKLAGIKRRMGGGTIKGLEFAQLPESLSGQQLLNSSKNAIPGIVKFITENVPITEFENPWIERP